MSLPADAILQDAREKKRVWSLDHLKAMRADRNRYVALYKRKKQLMEKKKTVPYDIFTHTLTTHCQLTILPHVSCPWKKRRSSPN
jgi:hypothetical protein